MFMAALFLAALAATPPNIASQIPPAIYTDPQQDSAHPARMEVLHIPSGDVQINGVAYLAAGLVRIRPSSFATAYPETRRT